MDAQTAMTPRSRFAFAIVVAVALAIGIATWMRLPHGGLPSLSFDGFRYLAGAYSFGAKGTYLDIDGSPQRVWPPGTSMLYAVVSSMSGRAPEALPGFVGIAAYLVAMIAIAITLAASVRRAWIASVAFIALSCNTFIVSMTNKLWSDPIALACLSVAFALLIVAKPSPRIIVTAAILVAAGIAFRYAMIAAIVLPIWTAWRLRVRWLAPLAGCCLGLALVVIASRVGGIHPLPWREDLRAFESLAGQLVPVQLGAVGFLILTIAVVTSARYSSQATVVASVWIAAYVAFLFVAQTIARPSFAFDLRILVPLYPAIVIAIASAADTLFEAKRTIVGTTLVAILLIADIRALHGLAPHHDAPPLCVSREQIVATLQARRIDAGQLSSNAQGLVWYALRRPVNVTPMAGNVVVMVDPKRVCEGVIETRLTEVPGTRVIPLP
jgi:hypothetical protein